MYVGQVPFQVVPMNDLPTQGTDQLISIARQQGLLPSPLKVPTVDHNSPHRSVAVGCSGLNRSSRPSSRRLSPRTHCFSLFIPGARCLQGLTAEQAFQRPPSGTVRLMRRRDDGRPTKVPPWAPTIALNDRCFQEEQTTGLCSFKHAKRSGFDSMVYYTLRRGSERRPANATSQ